MFDLGDVVPLPLEVLDADGNYADPGGLTLTIELPSGGTVSPAPVRDDVGRYHVDYATTLPGRHVARWVATGAHAGAHVTVFAVADPADSPVISLDEAREYLRMPAGETKDDDELRLFLDAATASCESHRALRRRIVVEQHSPGSPLLLQRTPVVSVMSVVDADGNTISADRYRVDLAAGIVTGYGMPACTVTYVAGHAVVPANGRLAVLEQLRHMWTTQRGPRPAFGGRGADNTTFVPGAAHTVTYRVRELLDSLAETPGFA